MEKSQTSSRPQTCDQEKKKFALKVSNIEKTRKFGLMTSSLEELSSKCKKLFDLEENTDVRFLLEDNTELSENEFLESLEGGTLIYCARPGETLEEPVQNTSARNTEPAGAMNEDSRVMKLIQDLRKKRKSDNTTVSTQVQKDRSILVQVGWLDYSFKEARYKLVKTSKQRPTSGPQTIKLEAKANFENVEEQLKGIFFPCRRSIYGHERKFNFFVANYNGEKIEPSVTIGEYFKERSTGQRRLYLFSKMRSPFPMQDSDSSPDSDEFELPEITFKKRRTTTATSTVTSAAALDGDSLENPGESSASTSRQITEDVLAPQPSIVQYAAETPASSQITQEVLVQQPSMAQYVAEKLPAAGSPPEVQVNVLSQFDNAGTPTVEFRSRLCIVCFDREPTAYYFPCGHTSCLPCALHLYENTACKKCPTCRQKIESIRNIYSDI